MTDPVPLRLTPEQARERLTQRDNLMRAGGIKTGRDLARKEMEAERARLEGQHAGQLEGVTKAHEAELKRVAKLVGKAAFREGGLLGVVFGMGLAASLIAGTWWLAKDAVMVRTAAERSQVAIDAGPVPSLEQWQREQAQRAEPGREQ